MKSERDIRDIIDEIVNKHDFKAPEYDGVGGVKIQHEKQVVFMNAEQFDKEIKKRCKIYLAGQP